jgi:hypothetical protein
MFSVVVCKKNENWREEDGFYKGEVVIHGRKRWLILGDEGC